MEVMEASVKVVEASTEAMKLPRKLSRASTNNADSASGHARYYHADPYDRWKRVTLPQYFLFPRGAFSRSETRIDQWQVFKVLCSIQPFAKREPKLISPRCKRTCRRYFQECL